MSKLTTEQVFRMMENNQTPHRDEYMDLLLEDHPGVVEFMYDVKGVFGGCSMPRLYREPPAVPFKPLFVYETNEDGVEICRR